MTRSAFRRLCAAAVLLAVCAPLHAEQRVTRPYIGVTYIDRTDTSPRTVHMHLVQIDLDAPGLRFTLSPPAGDREVVRQTTLEFLKQERAQVAINAHYFLPFPSADTEAWLVGMAVSEGRVYSAFESPAQDYALLADAPGVNIDRANHASIVHRDRARADGTHVAEPVMLWTTLAGSAQIMTGGAASVPDLAWYRAVNARTAIGLSRDRRTLTLFTVDKSGESEGMQVGEVADLLRRDYGVWDALNLDGGGSTTMVLQDPATREASVVNASSDNPAGRSVGSSLAVFARPNP